MPTPEEIRVTDEIQIGPFIFEYMRPGMGVCKGEEQIGYAEIVTPEEWEEFVEATKAIS